MENLYKNIRKIKDPNNINSLLNSTNFHNNTNRFGDFQAMDNENKVNEIISEINTMKLLDKLILYKHIFDYNNI